MMAMKGKAKPFKLEKVTIIQNDKITLGKKL